MADATPLPIEHVLGLRRLLSDLPSGERMAVNMPVQGLAADIMKLAMIAADQMAEEKYPGKAQMLLQVHDEIIFEVEASQATDFARDLKHIMEQVYTLRVPLIAEQQVGILQEFR
jgi:DNA polymerase-1